MKKLTNPHTMNIIIPITNGWSNSLYTSRLLCLKIHLNIHEKETIKFKIKVISHDRAKLFISLQKHVQMRKPETVVAVLIIPTKKRSLV